MEENIEKYLTENSKRSCTMARKSNFIADSQNWKSLLKKITASESPTKRSIKEELYCLNNVLEECQMLARKQSLASLKTVLRPSIVQISRDLDKIKQKLHKIYQFIASLHETFCRLPERLEASRDSSTWVNQSRVRRLENEMVTLERMLLQPGKSSNSFNAIAIVSMSGIGKMTLAQLVYNKQEVNAQFLPRIWVSLSPQPNMADNLREATAKKLLARLGVEKDIISSIESHGLCGLHYALHLQLLGKRYLIVLDDVWDTNPWHNNDAWDGLPKGYGGLVIITSRSEKVANTMVGEENALHLQPLTDPESCWYIFKDEVEKDGEKLDDDNINKLKPEVEKKSAGLKPGLLSMVRSFCFFFFFYGVPSASATGIRIPIFM